MNTHNGAAIQRRTTTSDLKALGLDLGVQCAKIILQNDSSASLRREVVLSRFQDALELSIREQKITNGLTVAGEHDYRLGFLRGLASQLLHPHADIETKIVKAPIGD